MADQDVDLSQYVKEKTATAGGGDVDLSKYLSEKTGAAQESAGGSSDDGAKSRQDYIADMQGSAKASNNALFNTLTFGHLPQIEAKASQIFHGEGMANDDKYVARRDQNIGEQKALADKYQMANAQGTIAGFLLPALATMGASAPVMASAEAAPAIEGAAAATPALASKIGTIAKGAATGAGMGALQNPGDNKGVVDPLQLQDRAKNATIGAGIGGTMSAAGTVAPKVLSYLGDKAGDLAESSAFKATGAMLKDFRNAFSHDQINDLGRFALDNNLVAAGDSVEKVAQKASALQQQSGDRLGQIFKAAQAGVEQATPEQKAAIDAAGFNPVRDKGAIMSAAKTELGSAVDRKSALNKLSNYIDDLAEEHGDKVLDAKTANDIKTSLDQKIRYTRNPLQPDPEAETALYSARKIIANKISEHVDAIGQAFGQDEGGVASALKDANAQYGKSKTIADIANDRTLRNSANNSFSLTDKISGAAGGVMAAAALHSTPEALALAGAGAVGSKVLKKYGTSTIAAGLDAASGLISKSPALAAAAANNPAVQAGVNRTMISDSAPAAANAAAKEKPTPDGKRAPADDTSQPPMNSPTPTKGPEKWAADGHDKIMEHVAGTPEAAMIEQNKAELLKDPKTKSLLVNASDLKPGSKAMENIVDKIKSKVAGG